MIERLGALNGAPVVARALAPPNFSLEDHWNSGDALREVRTGGYSVVVLQQGPSALPESRVSLRRFTRSFADEIRKTGGRTALYMVWPSKSRFGDFDRVSESYRLAASDVQGTLLRAGDAWREAWKRDTAMPLYAADEFHPSMLGSYLAALVIFQGLTDLTVTVHMPLDGRDVDAARLRVLDAAAKAVRGRPPKRGRNSPAADPLVVRPLLEDRAGRSVDHEWRQLPGSRAGTEAAQSEERVLKCLPHSCSWPV
jgi:hypothetical protein